MYKTEKEIFSQAESLSKTNSYLKNKKDEIYGFFKKYTFKNIVFTGCGSSYSLCKSAEISLKLREINAFSIPSGDLMLNFSHYKKIISDSLLIAPSRSGSTSEVINAVKKAKDEFNVKCICISAKKESDLSKTADLNLEIPWAFDESVCQTRTVSNLYTVNLLLTGIITGDDKLIQETEEAVKRQAAHIDKYKSTLKKVASDNDWNKAVVLADSELEGIAEEGALAFKEICQLPSNYYHFLDVRHGPMVMVDGSTLVIAVCSPYGVSYQTDLIKELKNKNATVITVSSKPENNLGADYNITVPDYTNYAVSGIPFIYIPQAITFFKAVKSGVNPDLPQGLDPWIKL